MNCVLLNEISELSSGMTLYSNHHKPLYKPPNNNDLQLYFKRWPRTIDPPHPRSARPRYRVIFGAAHERITQERTHHQAH